MKKVLTFLFIIKLIIIHFFLLKKVIEQLKNSASLSELPTKQKGVRSFHGGSTNCWAELDLNQRRRVVNEFTVRPH